MSINNKLVKKVLEIDVDEAFECEVLSGINDVGDRDALTYCSSIKFIEALNSKKKVVAVFIRQDLEEYVNSNIKKIVVDDPVYNFYKLHNFLVESVEFEKTQIGHNCKISEKASISEKGVKIADNVNVEENVVISSGVKIGSGCVIRAGAVIGIDGFEMKRTSKGILSAKHDGEVVLGSGVEVGVNCQVAKGFSHRNTTIGKETKIDALSHIAHGVVIGERCLVAANVTIAGSATIGCNVWIGPSSSISNRVRIGDNASVSIGSVVVSSVPDGETVTGNFAIQHMKFLKNFKDSLKL